MQMQGLAVAIMVLAACSKATGVPDAKAEEPAEAIRLGTFAGAKTIDVTAHSLDAQSKVLIEKHHTECVQAGDTTCVPLSYDITEMESSHSAGSFALLSTPAYAESLLQSLRASEADGKFSVLNVRIDMSNIAPQIKEVEDMLKMASDKVAALDATLKTTASGEPEHAELSAEADRWRQQISYSESQLKGLQLNTRMVSVRANFMDFVPPEQSPSPAEPSPAPVSPPEQPAEDPQ